MAVSNLVPTASGPTLAEITAAGNAAGWGAIGGGPNWTPISTTNVSGTNSLTYNSLSGYKYYRLTGVWSSGGENNIWLRINGNSSSNYQSAAALFSAGSAGGADTFSSTEMYFTPNAGIRRGVLDAVIINANTTGTKLVNFQIGGRDGSGASRYWHGIGNLAAETDVAISSLQIVASNQAFGTGFITLYGGN